MSKKQLMNKKLPLFVFILASLVFMFNAQSCAELSTSDSDTAEEAEATVEEVATTTTTTTTTEVTEKKHSEMTVEEQSEYIAKHIDQLTMIETKRKEIINEHIHKKDQFSFECESGKISLERHYNDDDEIHLLTYTICKDNSCSTKHHFFSEDKLIYQFYHHVVEDGDKISVDDHNTFFNDGKMIKCLEKDYSYVNGEKEPDASYKLVDCTPLDKLTSDIEKLLKLPEEEAKAYLCK